MKSYKLRYYIGGFLFLLCYPFALLISAISKKVKYKTDTLEKEYEKNYYSILSLAIDIVFCDKNQTARDNTFILLNAESGWGKSNFAKKFNNYSGMSNTESKFAVVQNTTTKEADGSMKKRYSSVYQCVFDFWLYCYYRQPAAGVAIEDSTGDSRADALEFFAVLAALRYFTTDGYTYASNAISGSYLSPLGAPNKQYFYISGALGVVAWVLLAVWVYKNRKKVKL